MLVLLPVQSGSLIKGYLTFQPPRFQPITSIVAANLLCFTQNRGGIKISSDEYFLLVSHSHIKSEIV